jgi:hypothetical protein
METSLLKLTMHANNKQALEPPLTCSLVTTLWSNMGSSIFKTVIVEVFKVGGNFDYHGFGQCGGQTMFFNYFFHEIQVQKQIDKPS